MRQWVQGIIAQMAEMMRSGQRSPGRPTGSRAPDEPMIRQGLTPDDRGGEEFGDRPIHGESGPGTELIPRAVYDG